MVVMRNPNKNQSQKLSPVRKNEHLSGLLVEGKIWIKTESDTPAVCKYACEDCGNFQKRVQT